MRWSSLNTPLGLTDTSNRKMEGAGISPGAAALGAVGDMLLGIWSTYETNDSNERIARRTNEANKEINDSQIAWAREKYRAEKAENRFLVDQAYRRELENRAYNSPSAVKQRYLQAGINPYLAMYQGANGGSQSSIGSTVGSPPKYDNPNMIPMQTGAPAIPYPQTGFGLAAQHMMDFHLAAERNQADIAALKTKTNLAALETFAKISNYNWNNRHLKALAESVEQDIKWNNENWSARSEALRLANEKIAADMDYQKSMIEYQRILNKFAPKNQQQLLNNLEAEYDQIRASAYKNDREGALAAANRALVNVEKDTKEKMADFIVDDAMNRADESYWRSQNEGKEFYEGKYEGQVIPGHNNFTGERYEYRRSGRVRYNAKYEDRNNRKSSGGIR